MSPFRKPPNILYYRNLPHYDPPGATLFITFRLAGSLPKKVVEQLIRDFELAKKQLELLDNPQEQQRLLYLEQRKYFGRWDKELDKMNHGPLWLSDPAIAELLQKSILHRDNKVYQLYAYCIMANHVHILFAPLSKTEGSYFRMWEIMKSLKGYTARKANLLLGHSGTFWHDESYDHVVRNADEHQRIVHYIHNNPVKAGLVKYPEQWPWSSARKTDC